MNLTAQIAKHFRDVHFGKNWTASNLKDHLKDVTWQQATTQVYSLNTIASLVFHINYYVSIILSRFFIISIRISSILVAIFKRLSKIFQLIIIIMVLFSSFNRGLVVIEKC